MYGQRKYYRIDIVYTRTNTKSIKKVSKKKIVV